MAFYVYIITNKKNGTLYIGQTDNLCARIWTHRQGAVPGFATKYGCKRLVWYDFGETREGALIRERQLKKWNRAWKIRLIEETNPDWRDLYEEVCGA